jgi:hypothetical protein
MTGATTSPVLAALAQARMRAAPMFARWCELNRISFCPAAPADVARFVGDCASLGVGRLWPAVQEVSRLHASMGLADPTLGGAVAAAITDLADIAPPRSWPNDRKERFKSLPHDLQVFVVSHEARREKALRRAQNVAAIARQELARLRAQQIGTADQIETEGTEADDRKGHESDPRTAT